MKNCPKCNAEIEPGFELCWNCNYSFAEQRVIEPEEPEEEKVGTQDINCLRCHVKLLYSGNYKFHEGTKLGLFGNMFEMFVNRESFDIYVCPKCGKAEFFVPLN